MSAQMADTVQCWCSCVRQCVEHTHIGVQDFGWAVMDTYQCTRCNTLKLFLVREGRTLSTDVFRQCETRPLTAASALKPGLSSA